MSDSEKYQNERNFKRNHDRSPDERNSRGRKHSRSRSRSLDGDRQSKRRQGERCELRLLIQSKDAGSIIGRGGMNIKRLRQDFKAGVTVSDSRAPERIVAITGDSSSVSEVLDEILSKSLEERRDSSRRDSEVEVKMLVHQSQAGCIIGKAGNNLKEMRQDFGVDIKVYSQCCPRSSERVVLVTGKPRSICRCITNIADLVKTWPPRGQAIPYDPVNYDDSAVRDYGGYLDDERGRRDRGRGRRLSEGRERSSSLAGGLSSVTSGGRRISQQVSIPSELAGVIIGKGGQNIRQIRLDSGAEVDLSDSTGSSDRIITIAGSPDQIENAQHLLQMCVKQHLARN